MTLTEIYAAALLEVNSLRQRLGMAPLSELPKGVPGDGGNCPIQRALNCAKVESTYMHWYSFDDISALYPDGKVPSISTPQALVAFIAAFDDGNFPELVERET